MLYKLYTMYRCTTILSRIVNIVYVSYFIVNIVHAKQAAQYRAYRVAYYRMCLHLVLAQNFLPGQCLHPLPSGIHNDEQVGTCALNEHACLQKPKIPQTTFSDVLVFLRYLI